MEKWINYVDDNNKLTVEIDSKITKETINNHSKEITKEVLNNQTANNKSNKDINKDVTIKDTTNKDVTNKDITKIENNKDSTEIQDSEMTLPDKFNPSNFLQLLKTMHKVIVYLQSNIPLSISEPKYKLFLNEAITAIVDTIKIKHSDLVSEKLSRCSYNFCKEFPICYSHYKHLLYKCFEKKICNSDHLVFNKIYKDIKLLNDNIGDISTSLKTLNFVFKHHNDQIDMINNLLSDKKSIKFNNKVNLLNFLMTFK